MFYSNARPFILWAAMGVALPHAVAAEIDGEDLEPQAVTGETKVDFATDVQPIFREHCFECHAGEVEEGGLNLGIRSKVMKGGDSGNAFEPGNSNASLLVRLIDGDDERPMPPEGNVRLPKQQVQTISDWIDQGATWPDGADVIDARMDRAERHWAYQRLAEVQPPARHDDDAISKTAIDLFIADKLRANGLSLSPMSSAGPLVRRLYFNVIGLPPNPKEIASFAHSFESDPDSAVDNLVDALLESHHYGERWARHWLDVARFAESDGQESDRDRPHAWRFRDFVIKAFNDDMAYDEFVRWQIAGDEYEPDNDWAVSATGFLAAGPSMKLEEKFLERERLFNRYNELDDIVSTVGTGLLGLTTGCARCHDHKYDMFSSREYYQLLRVFHSGDRVNAKLPSGQDGFFFQDFDATPRTTWLFRRSDFYDREIEVDFGLPVILSRNLSADEYWSKAKQAVPNAISTLQRRAFADWITDTQHGGGEVLARVFVNRVWQHHFGEGLVRTPSDFGVRGEPPTHPELLEFLTHDFVQHGWRIKRLHKLILSSAVWQQGGLTHRPSSNRGREVDPQNRLLWMMPPRRLEAEAMRDAMLAVSGTLNLEAGGPGFKPYIPPEANLARNIQGGDYPKNAKDDATTRRRSIYMFHKRLVPYPLFQAFDRPDLMTSCARRQNTTVAPQAIAILNDKFVRAVAGDFATRLIESNSSDDRKLVAEAFELSFGRPPNETELNTSADFICTQTESRKARSEDSARYEAVTDFCHTLFGLNEFIYVD
ncbi:MAG: PSD1 domain-containing protein [Planctomycetales bacterium]|nr:PSD1 domain-containing protein [Planctomycetales bacterium]